MRRTRSPSTARACGGTTSAWTATASTSAKLSSTFLSSSSSWKGAQGAAGRRLGILGSSSQPPAWTRP
eukprot:1820377-Heterocapsa_arctica.AAC.1